VVIGSKNSLPIFKIIINIFKLNTDKHTARATLRDQSMEAPEFEAIDTDGNAAINREEIKTFLAKQ
jgi:hypothetical protein